MEFTIFAVAGLFVGSFLNVLVLRLRDGEGFVTGRSRCPKCRKQIAWYDNIPLLSFLLLNGRCRRCGQPISLQYPVVEALTGLVFGLSVARFGPLEQASSFAHLGIFLVTIALLLAIAVYDALTMEIEMRLFFAALVAGGTYLFFDWILDPKAHVLGLWGNLAAGGAAALLLGSIVWYSRERWMGWGDVWLVFLLGLLVGPAGLLPMLTLSFGSGAVVGIGLMLSKKKSLKSALPLGPFLVFGTVAQVFFGQELIASFADLTLWLLR